MLLLLLGGIALQLLAVLSLFSFPKFSGSISSSADFFQRIPRLALPYLLAGMIAIFLYAAHDRDYSLAFGELILAVLALSPGRRALWRV